MRYGDAYLYRHVEQGTRRRGSDEPFVLVLVLTDEFMQISDIAYDSPLGKSYHSTLIFQFDYYVEKPTQTETFNYLKGDYEYELRNRKH